MGAPPPEAQLKDCATPVTAGYGITAGPTCGVSVVSSFAAEGLSIKEPWRVINVDLTGCSIEDCSGYITREVKLTAAGEKAVTRITVKEGLALSPTTGVTRSAGQGM